MKLSQVPFKRPCGIELTFLPDRDPDFKSAGAGNYGFKNPSIFCNATNEYQGLMEELVGSQCGDWDYSYNLWGQLYTDPGCTEYASPILKCWEHARSWYQFAVALGEQLQLTTYHPKQVGGMGHVHMAMKSEHAHRVSWDLIQRPYLAWVFAEADQNEYCQSICDINSYANSYRPWSGMHSLLRWNREYKTLEWRGFDSAVDWSEQEEHLAFYQRYAEWCVRNARLPDQWYDHGQTLLHFRDKKQGKDRCAKAFRELIILLELPWSRYSWYVDCHLEAQFKWGRRL